LCYRIFWTTHFISAHGFWPAFFGSRAVSQERQKLSRAAISVNRECGTESIIGGGSGELLGNKIIGKI